MAYLFNKTLWKWYADKGLMKSFRMMFSNIGLSFHETLPLSIICINTNHHEKSFWISSFLTSHSFYETVPWKMKPLKSLQYFVNPSKRDFNSFSSVNSPSLIFALEMEMLFFPILERLIAFQIGGNSSKGGISFQHRQPAQKEELWSPKEASCMVSF